VATPGLEFEVSTVTTTDDCRPLASLASGGSESTASLGVRELVTQLARAEDLLRRWPDDPEAADRMRLLVRELRRRRARMRLERLLAGQESRED
jgi:hypothetical protein